MRHLIFVLPGDKNLAQGVSASFGDISDGFRITPVTLAGFFRRLLSYLNEYRTTRLTLIGTSSIDEEMYSYGISSSGVG